MLPANSCLSLNKAPNQVRCPKASGARCERNGRLGMSTSSAQTGTPHSAGPIDTAAQCFLFLTLHLLLTFREPKGSTWHTELPAHGNGRLPAHLRFGRVALLPALCISVVVWRGTRGSRNAGLSEDA